MIKISAYTTSRNTLGLDYPLKECVESLKEFADEIVIADSTDTDDGTRDLLSDLEKSDSRIKVYHNDLDYKAPNHAVFDGQQKAFARSKCTGQILYQIDNDEIVHEEDAPRIRQLAEQFPPNGSLFALPVIEYWGSTNKVRIDVNVWKWRISKNEPNITHGIPFDLRVHKNGLLYSKPGSDGCDYVDMVTGQPISFITFVNSQSEALRLAAVKDKRYVTHFEEWFNNVTEQLPGVYHFSWFSIERKIKTYKNYWNKHWKSMYGEEQNNTNPFFDVDWSQVSDDMIKSKAKELREMTGGHVFHQKWTPGMKTNAIHMHRNPPKFIKNWIETHKDE